MAKTTRGGLGRGLGALMGEPVPQEAPQPKEEPKPKPKATQEKTPTQTASPAPKSESQPVNTAPSAPVVEEKPAPRPATKAAPKRATQPLSERPEAQAAVNPPINRQVGTEKGKSFDQAIRAANANIKSPYIEEDDGVVIKSVASRDKNVVDVNQIVPNPDQPRTHFDEQELDELAESIKKNGLLQPILVRRVGKEYQIIAGERRWQASKRAGLKQVPVSIMKADDDKVIELALVENIQRADLNPIEEAYGYRRLMDRKGMTQVELAQAVSKGRSTIANSLRLLELPEDAQQLLFENKITAGHARAILSIPSRAGKETLTRKLVETTMSVRDAENLARLLSGKKSETTSTRTPVPKEYRATAKRIGKALGMSVRVKSAKGKNKIEIEFKDQEDLDALLEKVSKAAE